MLNVKKDFEKIGVKISPYQTKYYLLADRILPSHNKWRRKWIDSLSSIYEKNELIGLCSDSLDKKITRIEFMKKKYHPNNIFN